MLVRLLGSLPGCCCWYEPNALWRAGHAYRDSDRADETDAKPWVRRWIRRAFLRYQHAHGGARVIEKSPYNVLRLKYIHAIFPEAKIIHIHRDGRANLRSQVEKIDTFKAFSDAPLHHVLRRVREVPPWELPAYLPRAARGLFRTYLSHRSIDWFGLRYPGWKRDRENLTAAQIAARQWCIAVETALDDLRELPEECWMAVTYEDLVRDPRLWFGRMIEFGGLSADTEFWQRVDDQVHVESIDRWREELDQNALDEAMPKLEPVLRRLGYLP